MKRDARALVIEMYKAIETVEERGSVDRARAAARAAGARFSNAESMQWLKPFLDSAAVRRRAPRRKNGVETTRETAEKRRDARHAVGLTREIVIPSTPSSSSLRSEAPDGLFPTTKTTAPKAAPDTAWVAELIADVKKLKSSTIASLAPDQRLLLARYHCLKFGNCTKNAGSNRRRATQVAAGFMAIAGSKYGVLTVAEYVGFARKVHESRDGAPWFNPFFIKAAMELANAAPAAAMAGVA